MNTKTLTVIYWITTGIIFLFEGVLTAITSHTQMAIDGIRHLGYAYIVFFAFKGWESGVGKQLSGIRQSEEVAQ
jgi:threonine/homoserine/homoserine lactone efflux protein